MKSSNSQFQPHDTVLLSGWVFADLLLGLMVIFLVSLPGNPESIIIQVSTTPTLTSTPTLTPVPTQTARPEVTPVPTVILTPTPQKIIALSQKEITIIIDSISDLNEIRNKINKVIAGKNNIRVGLVLTSGYGGANASRGHTIAKSLNDSLRKEFPQLFDKAVMRDYHDLLGTPINGAEVVLYLLVEVENS